MDRRQVNFLVVRLFRSPDLKSSAKILTLSLSMKVKKNILEKHFTCLQLNPQKAIEVSQLIFSSLVSTELLKLMSLLILDQAHHK